MHKQLIENHLYSYYFLYSKSVNYYGLPPEYDKKYKNFYRFI